MENYILNKLEELKDDNLTSFHVPGHKTGKIFRKLGYKNILEKIYTLDTTEIDGTDNLHNAKEIIKESQDRAARVFNSDKTIYLVNGTTCGIEASIMAVCNPKSKIIVNRDCHQSAINACILGDIDPVYIESVVCKKTNIIMGVDVESTKSVIDNNLDAKAIVLTYPTYYGKTFDLKSVCDYAHSKNIIVIVDEAHGAHLQLSNNLPKSAIEQEADIIIQSTHKTLPSFTQSSMMHVKGNRVDTNKIEAMLRFLESSSPSYILLTSLELAVDIYDNYGIKLMENLLSNINNFKSKFKNNENIIIDNNMDKTKIFISLKKLGITGYELDSILREKYKIQVELSNYYGVLLICTIGNDEEDFVRLKRALDDFILNTNDKELLEDINYPESIPEKVLNPRQAFYSDKHSVKLEDSIGKISGEYIIPYPPGISLISPGEIITKEIITYIQEGVKSGMIVSGIKDVNLEYIDVIDINQNYF
ncbi:MAG: aminotransferase class I/II-fold pyridoxal phosphate-dependent enzyme [Terrisporobacter othiniensis]|uniref:aminotransferase class I/II-fold pyridoxal phosphate-dependent enzyme n=1 Tax=Terrisporobacter petrolearius TaxID=1460447 RepID=UPI0022E6F45F|nr:aminotransferase class I/II-fold pyridoxal phosphate-dependent enzyme [Terrisporobacter petrolearius]MDU4861357.1 aminotransferase class I/II-fold pyridoxal phosphate-dependent enzyme [Terrisporobacter othiniensis]MDU6994991.1 aminotransferase class I/II-fold pyridoxal phosphate-dependent enzyme [Terrisporobacter othiniensis]